MARQLIVLEENLQVRHSLRAFDPRAKRAGRKLRFEGLESTFLGIFGSGLTFSFLGGFYDFRSCGGGILLVRFAATPTHPWVARTLPHAELYSKPQQKVHELSFDFLLFHPETPSSRKFVFFFGISCSCFAFRSSAVHQQMETIERQRE
jgi:hypothetical protein